MAPELTVLCRGTKTVRFLMHDYLTYINFVACPFYVHLHYRKCIIIHDMKVIFIT